MKTWIRLALWGAMLAAGGKPAALLLHASEPQVIPSFPAGVSGVTWAGGRTYWLVTDAGGGASIIRMELNLVKENNSCRIGRVTFGAPVRLQGAHDPEAIAYDPLTKAVWVADEALGRLQAYDCASGEVVDRLLLPSLIGEARSNLGLESLAISPDGKSLWTCTEEALTRDGALSDKPAGTIVRLLHFERLGAKAPWVLTAMYPYVTACLHRPRQGSISRRGVADLAVLEDGQLLALEREQSGTCFYASIYELNVREATEVKALPSLRKMNWKPVGKKELFARCDQALHWDRLYNFEGLCGGPILSSGVCALVAVTDAGEGWTSAAIWLLTKKVGE